MKRSTISFVLVLLLVLAVMPVAFGENSVKIKVPAEYSIDGKTSYDLTAKDYAALLNLVHASIQDELDEMCKGFYHYESIVANEDCTEFTITVNSAMQSVEELEAENLMYEMRQQYAAYSSDEAEGVRINYQNMKGELMWFSEVGAPLLLLAEQVQAYAGQSGAASQASEPVKTVPAPTPAPTPEPTRSEPSYSYVLNTNTKKFHYPDCKSVSQMKEKNKWYYDGTRSEIISMGYSPCGNCHP